MPVVDDQFVKQVWGIVLVLAVVFTLMFLLYTVPRWIWGFGLDLFPVEG